MPVQDEVMWVLETIKSNWPGDWPADDDGQERLYRVNRDDPEVLETGERKKEVPFETASPLGASLGSRDPTPIGTEYDHDVTTTIDCRIKGLTTRHRGHIESDNHAKQLALYAQHAILQERSYPTVDPDADDIGRVDYHTARVTGPTNSSREYLDEYLWTWTVELDGYETIDQ